METISDFHDLVSFANFVSFVVDGSISTFAPLRELNPLLSPLLAQLFEKSFSLQFVGHTFVDELFHIDFTFGFAVPIAH